MLTSNSKLIDSTEITVIGAGESLNMNDFNEIIVLIAIEIIVVLTAIAIKSASFIRSRDIS